MASCLVSRIVMAMQRLLTIEASSVFGVGAIAGCSGINMRIGCGA